MIRRSFTGGRQGPTARWASKFKVSSDPAVALLIEHLDLRQLGRRATDAPENNFDHRENIGRQNRGLDP
jgi:hypothetical protein